MDNFDEDIVRKAFSEAESINDFARKLGVRMNNGTNAKARRIASKFGLDCNDIKGDPLAGLKKYTSSLRISDDNFFVFGKNRGGPGLKKRMLSLGVIEECAEYNLGPFWNGKELVLQVDHIDGNNFNNIFTNLRLICPNCHTQTETYANRNAHRYGYCECGNRITPEFKSCDDCGVNVISIAESNGDIAKFKNCDCGNIIDKRSKNCRDCFKATVVMPKSKQKLDFPPLDELIEEIQALGWTGAGRKFGIIDNTLRKFVVRNGVDPKTIKRTPKSEKVK